MGFAKSKKKQVAQPSASSPLGRLFGRNPNIFAQREAALKAQREAEQRAQRQQQGRGAIDNAFGQFDDNYFNSLKQNYAGFYDQSVQDEYNRKRNELASGFQNTQGAGAFDYVNLFDALDREYAGKGGQAQTAADTYVSGVRNDVNANRNSLYYQNDQMADPNAISQTAGSTANSIRNRQFSPLGSMFAGIRPSTGVSTAPNQPGGNVNYGSFASAAGSLNPAAFNIAPTSTSRVVS